MNNKLKGRWNNAEIPDFQAPSRHLSGENNQDPNTCLNILSPDRDLNLRPAEKKPDCSPLDHDVRHILSHVISCSNVRFDICRDIKIPERKEILTNKLKDLSISQP